MDDSPNKAPSPDRQAGVPIRPRRPGVLPWVLAFMVVAAALYLGQRPRPGSVEEVSLDKFLEWLEQGNIKTIVHTDGQLKGELKDGGPVRAYVCQVPPDYLKDPKKLDEIRKSLAMHGGAYSYEGPNQFLQIVLGIVPWLLAIFLAWWLISRQLRAQGGIGNAISFGRSRARKLTKDQRRVTFDDVAGIDAEKEDVTEIIEYLRDPSRFQRLGARIPRGVLLVGPPGTGKTLLAKAIAGEADVPFYSICGSDFVEMFVGVGASRVRDLFRQAKQDSPCVIFLDEIDAVGRRRGSGLGGNHDEREQTLNAILVEMDGFDTDDGVIVVAATNRPDILDPALLRPGRFDRTITIDLPDVRGRYEILQVHAKKVKMARQVDLHVLAKTTPTFSGADLEATINEAALIAAMKRKSQVEAEDLEEARDKVKWGRQKKNRVLEEEDRRVTAYHEAGHTIVARRLEGLDPVHKVTIIPRGAALGITMNLPEKDRLHLQKEYVLKQIAMLFGGRASEEIFVNDISSGARNDIKQATQLATLMVCEWGMSEHLGPIAYMDQEEHLFLGREIARSKTHSEATAQEIDREVRRIIDGCFQKARAIVRENREGCDRVARALLRYEVLTGQEVDRILSGTDIDRLRDSETETQVQQPEPQPVPSPS